MKYLYKIIILLTLPYFTLAQQSYSFKPYAITLPQVSTTQQENPATVPQSAGNVGYNTSEQKVAINTGGAATGVTPLGYSQKDASTYVITLRLSDGGTAFGVQPGITGIEPTVALLNNSTAIGNLVFYGANFGELYPIKRVAFPVVGACGYVIGGAGANGLIINRWQNQYLTKKTSSKS